MIYNDAQAERIVKNRLSQKRYEHSVEVARTAERMAMAAGLDPGKAYVTGILHDYAKNLSDGQLLEVARQAGLITDSIEEESPCLLHASVGAYLLETGLGIRDVEILSAVRAHTLGSMRMNTLDKIIYLADMIEPTRQSYPGLERLRQLVEQDLDTAMLFGLESTIRHCLDRGRLLHPTTVEARNQFLRRMKGNWPEG
ncbi:MAG TPA: bis(5'-nucleosyl)-tetraphosphatase (symmetrical) YqeK [Syntrophomonadaceae bacterium]|jgi:predicted HD superfamily hydrolase involved in NAD metabolism|nr:bis(5'-nucleosyl)-tetraphosphatase (symmetrical) YqeK [Syntrophomonadaceae bacterium]